MTLWSAGVQLGTVTANAMTGAWSYDYSATTLPEGVTTFTATQTVGGLTGPMSPEFLVTVDLTPPAVTLTVPASTASLQPQVSVTASDLNGLPNGTAVGILVYASNGTTLLYSNNSAGTLTDGQASFRLLSAEMGAHWLPLSLGPAWRGGLADIGLTMRKRLSTKGLPRSQCPPTVADVGRLGGLCPGDLRRRKNSGRRTSLLIQISGQPNQTITGSTFVVAQDASPFGAGWTFGATDRLVTIAYDAVNNLPAGVLRIFGTGEYSFYAGTTTFTSPADDNGTLSLSGGVYTYTYADGRTEAFNSAGYETQAASADGQQTLHYRYDTSNRLTGMTAIDGALTTFS